jgi:hypothetical protein
MDVDRSAVLKMLAIVGPLTMSGSGPASSEEIYKSVDQAGKVTYSAAPLADAVTSKTVELPRQPTPEEVCAAEEQQQLIKTFGAELEKNRKQRAEEQARQAAEERAQQNSPQVTIVYWPVPVFVGPIRPLSNHRGQARSKWELRGQSEQPQFITSKIIRSRSF